MHYTAIIVPPEKAMDFVCSALHYRQRGIYVLEIFINYGEMCSQFCIPYFIVKVEKMLRKDFTIINEYFGSTCPALSVV